MGLVVVGSVAMALPLGMSTSAAAHLAGARAPDVEPQCQIHVPKPFVEAGEGATHSSASGTVTVECRPVYAQQKVTITADELSSRCSSTLKLYWVTPQPSTAVEGPSIDVTLDDNGEAMATFFGGPSCAAGTSLICAHLDVPPFTTACANFTILPPHNTPPGVKALPKTQVEDSINSSVMTTIYVEFPSVFSGQTVKIQSQELSARCAGGIVWIAPDGFGSNPLTGPFTNVTLDNNGNAFVTADAGPSCASGPSTIEASLTIAPFTTYTTTFTILSPRATCTAIECD